GAVRRVPPADLRAQRDRLRRLELVDVHDVGAVEHAEMDRLVQLAPQSLKRGPQHDADVQPVVEVERDPEKLRTQEVSAVLALRREAPLTQRGERTMQRALRQRERGRQFVQRRARAMPAEDLEHPDRAIDALDGRCGALAHDGMVSDAFRVAERRSAAEHVYRIVSGIRSPWASIRSSTIATISLVVRVAPVFGSSIAARYTSSRAPSTTARTVSSTTFRNVRLSARHWCGRAPIRVLRTPSASAVTGTSTPSRSRG